MSMNDLFYVLQETDLNNQELYLPPDTPFGKTNSQRLKALLKIHHAKQRERLLIQQVAELDDYQKDFANKNKEDLFITQTETACELMSGPDFLIERNDQIMELLSMIPLMNNTAEKDTEMSELTNSVVPEEKPLAPPPPSLPSDDEMNTSEDEEDSLNDMPQNIGGSGGNGGGDGENEAVHNQKMIYSSIIKKKYKKGFVRLRKLHDTQLKRLQNLQKEDLNAIREETPPPPLPAPVEAAKADRRSSPARNNKEQSPRPNSKDKQKQLERGRTVNEQQRGALSTAHQTAQQLQKNMHRDNQRFNVNKNRQDTDRDMPWNQHLQHKPHTNKIPDITTALKPPTVTSPRPPTVASLKPPIVATAGPPSVTTAGPPMIASSNRNNNNNSSSSSSSSRSGGRSKRGKLHKGRRDSNQPLFDTKPITFKPATLLGDTSGSIYIKNKPDRVIINGQDFGSPKDFDDAINGIQRKDNSILKRHLGGDTYLYFKPSAGQFVALGKVSRIQPFIHKFLLSK
ncbi:uncharacterized protein ATC70_005726 [Mucor velutinosus]|uniref:Uncharacterized protein n=1 Tax=Mucor velutinosus TaxID=708070 RepID=A0AAN7DA38_9FUNG|nr:hypothetical protein ATC70_005726 [Mucor velutinosus]